MNLDKLYHVGIVVDDFDAKFENLRSELNITWSPIIDVDISMWTRDFGVRKIRARAAYSVTFPHLELVQAVPNTPLTSDSSRPIHHFGVWSDDLKRDSDALVAQGYPRIMYPEHNGEMFGVAYHLRPDGMKIELVDRTSWGHWDAFLAGKVQHEVALPELPVEKDGQR
jgi:hypothetical protein